MGATMREDRYGVVRATLTPAQVAANTTAEQTFTVNGLKVGDVVAVNKPTSQAGLGLAGVRVSAADTLAITFINATGTPITPTASEVYLVYVFRAELPQTRFNV